VTYNTQQPSHEPTASPPILPGRRLLGNRPFRWFLASYGISFLGFWAFFLAILGQATYRYHANASQLALLLAIWSVVFLLLVTPAGMFTDRWSPKWFLVLAQAVAVISVVPAIFGRGVWALYVASVVDAVGAAASIPARGSLTPLLVPEEMLVQANGALNTVSMFGVVVGPGLAGLVARHGGQTLVYWCILGLIAAGLFLMLPLPDRRPVPAARTSFLPEIAEGFRISWREPELRSLLFLACSIWFLLTLFLALEPLFVKNGLHRGVDGLGLLWSANGVGAFLGALALARSKEWGGREVLLIGVSLIISGLGFLAFAGTLIYAVAIIGSAILGVGFAWFLSLSQALIQRVAAENMRGRVTGVFGALQEASAVACTLGIAVLGGLVMVRPYLIGSAVVLAAAGFYGFRADRRIRDG